MCTCISRGVANGKHEQMHKYIYMLTYVHTAYPEYMYVCMYVCMYAHACIECPTWTVSRQSTDTPHHASSDHTMLPAKWGLKVPLGRSAGPRVRLSVEVLPSTSP